jgi:sulfotransferase family protein
MQTTFDQTRSPLPVRILNELAGSLQKLSIERSAMLAADLIETARRRSGLDDFGPGDFFEPLSRLLESCQREARLNLIGRVALRSDLIRTLTNRLLMERDRQSDPGIQSEKIIQPLFIVGLPRSGTTLLHTLLAADPAHRAPLVWEAMFPSPPTSKNQQRRIRQTKQSLFFLQWLAPTFRQVHALGAELPQECVSLMSPSMLSDQFDTMYRVPSYRSWFFKQDLTPAYEYHRRSLQHLQRRKRAERWVLKAPAHMFALPALLSVYPDALFVQVHRNPLEAIASVSSLVAILRRVFSNYVDPREVGRDALQYWSDTLGVFLEQRDRLPRKRFFDLGYRDIRKDPIAAVRRLYSYFNWPLAKETENRMREVLRSQPKEQNGFHRYEPAQFGLEGIDVKSYFGTYCERFGLERNPAGRHLHSISDQDREDGA